MILVIGDIHLRQDLGYADYIKDRRVSEKKEILDFIVKSSEDCEKIVFMGDLLNGRNNNSEVNKELVEFLERFDGKELFIISGNHERTSGGKTALDFLKEIKGKHWHIMTEGYTTIDNFTFVPYFTKQELGTKDSKEATKEILEWLPKEGGDILFCHYALSETQTVSGCMTNLFDEVVLPRKELEKKYKIIVGGHIHAPYTDNKQVIVAGSIFRNEIGEHEKFIWKIDENLLTTEQNGEKVLQAEQIRLPGRGIYKVTDEADIGLELNKIPPHSIVKVILTKKGYNLEALKEKLKTFDAYIVLENYPSERKKILQTTEDVLDMDIEKLLNVYAKEKKISVEKLIKAWNLIKN